jgi:hypothetical protein
MSKPSIYINWSAPGVQPPSSLASAGYIPGQPVAAQHFNYLLNLIDAWIQWLDQQTTFAGAAPFAQTGNLGVNFLDGGTWSFTLSTAVLTWSGTITFSYPGIPDSANQQITAGSVTLADGQVAYTTVNAPVYMAADLANGSANLLNVAYPANLVVGMGVSAAGIPPGTTILSISGRTIGMSATATATALQQTCAFYGVGVAGVTVAYYNTVMAGPNTVVFARRFGSLVYVGAPGKQMIVRNLEQKPLLGRGYDSVVTLPCGPSAITAGQVVLIYNSSGTKVTAFDTGTFNNLPPSGIALNSATVGQSVDIVTSGLVSGLSGLVTGTPVFAVNGGGLTQTMPTAVNAYISTVGMALSATTMLLAPANTPNYLIPPPSRSVIGPYYWVSPASPASSMQYGMGGFVFNNSSAVVAAIGGSTSSPGWTAPYAGSVVSLCGNGGQNITAGSVNMWVARNLVTGPMTSSPNVTMNQSTTNHSAVNTIATGNATFAAGDRLYMGLTTSAGLTFNAPGFDFSGFFTVAFSA